MSAHNEFVSKIETLLAVTAQLAEQLRLNAALAWYVTDLSERRTALERAFRAGTARDQLRAPAQDLKTTLMAISMHHQKGDVAMENPEQLSEALDLVYVFQEAKYAHA